MRYVERDEMGAVVAHYATPQPDIGELELLPDDHPDLVAYAEARQVVVDVKSETRAIFNTPRNVILVKTIAWATGKTPAQVKAFIDAEIEKL